MKKPGLPLLVALIVSLVFLSCCTQAPPILTPPESAQTQAPSTSAPPESTPSVQSTDTRGPNLIVSDLMITPTEVKMRDNVGIAVRVTNNGDETGTQTISLEVNGQAIDSKEITLSAGASDMVSLVGGSSPPAASFLTYGRAECGSDTGK
ncbi:MAG: hypothetical protein HQ577_06495 [Dehalococcoidia bacterium]|nr:hypothetical protein [Dehalococcoidia bacterium]